MSRRRKWVLGTIGGIVLLVLFVLVDDPARDFTTHHAAISDAAKDPRLRPRDYEMSASGLADAVQRAARRIKSWQYVGTAGVDEATMVVFVRTSRVLKLEDDVVMRIEARGSKVRLTGESRSRVEYGDLGRNPRNLRRLLDELDTVLAADRTPSNAAP